MADVWIRGSVWLEHAARGGPTFMAGDVGEAPVEPDDTNPVATTGGVTRAEPRDDSASRTARWTMRNGNGRALSCGAQFRGVLVRPFLPRRRRRNDGRQILGSGRLDGRRDSGVGRLGVANT
ncbi:MAG: hypothetical protein Pars2KO_33300 [Parasphingorhabdus sp.]